MEDFVHIMVESYNAEKTRPGIYIGIYIVCCKTDSLRSTEQKSGFGFCF